MPEHYTRNTEGAPRPPGMDAINALHKQVLQRAIKEQFEKQSAFYKMYVGVP